MRILRSTVVLFMLLLCCFLPALAQNSKSAKKKYESYQKMRSGKDSILTDSLASLIIQVLEEENSLPAGKRDSMFMVKVAGQSADFLLDQGYFRKAGYCWYLAANILKNQGKDSLATDYITRYLYAYEYQFDGKTKMTSSPDLDTGFFRSARLDSTVWLSTTASRLRFRRKSDTIFVTIRAGRMHGVKTGGRLDVFTTFDTFSGYNRPSALAARGRITKVYDYVSTGYVVRDRDVRDTIYDRDCWAVQVWASSRSAGTVISSMAQNNIRFRDHRKRKYFIQGPGNLTLDARRWEQDLTLAMYHELRASDYYYTRFVDSSLFQTKVEKGRFKGLTFHEVVELSTVFDIRAFLDFVNSFPARYINKEEGFNFIEVYLTWVINDCVTGNDQDLIISRLISLTEQEMRQRPKIWKGYYNNITTTDTAIDQYISKVWADSAAARLKAYEQLKKLTLITANLDAYHHYNMQSLWEIYLSGDYKKLKQESMAGIDRTRDSFKRKIYYFYKASALNGLEELPAAVSNFDSSLAYDPDFTWSLGQKGWALTKMMSLNESLEVSLKAYNQDTTQQWSATNLAHVYLLMGNRAEAYRLYDRAFENNSSESGFYGGMITDFDYFIKKGAQVQEFRTIRTKLMDRYEKEKKHRIRADSLYSRGTTLIEKEKFQTARSILAHSLIEEQQVEPPRWERQRMLQRWTAYSYYKEKDYRTSLTYYLKAAEVSMTRDLGSDLLISDYEDVSNLYDWIGDTIRALEYLSRQTAIQTAVNEKREKKRLFAIIAGAGINGKNDLHAEADAAAFAQMLRSGSAMQFESERIDLLTGAACTPAGLMAAVDTVIAEARDNDVFVFYFAGHALRDLKSEKLVLHGGNLSFQTLVNSLGLISAGKQLHIADCNALSWRDWYTKQHFPVLNNASKSLVFMGYKNSRIEEKGGHAILTAALMGAYTDEAATGTVSTVSWLGHSVVDLYGQQRLFPVELLSYGHDFVLGKHKVMSTEKDKEPPVIELPGARKTRGDNIGLVSRQSSRSGTITDQSKILVATANGIPLTLSSTGRFEMPKSLENEEKITIYARDEFGNATTETFQIIQDNNPVTNEGTRYAYLIASDRYQYWSPLSNPVYDAMAIGQILKENYGYQVEIDSNLTQEQILEKLDQIRRASYKSKDQLLVFIAGHGVYDSIRQGSYVCIDSRPVKEDKFFSSYIRHKDIVEMLDGTSCKNVFLVMDVCFGGKMFDKQDTRRTLWINDGYGKSADEYIRQQLDIPCRQFLTSGGNNYVSDGTPGAHSPFASRFITALEDGAKTPEKSFVTASEIMSYLHTMRTVGNDLKSYPRFGSFGGNENGEYILPVVKKLSAPGKAAGYD